MNNLSDPVILVIDDDASSAQTTKQFLSSGTYRVWVANERRSALRLAAATELDLIICDVAVDYDCGFELLGDIRRLPGRSDVPVVFTSSAQLPDVVRRKHDFGDAFHLRKPFAPQVLIAIVEQALWMPALVQSHLQKHSEHSEVAAPHFLPSAPKINLPTIVNFPNSMS